MAKKGDPISFDLREEQRKAIETLAGGRGVRVSGRVRGDKVVVDFIACNAAFIACNASFTPCNASFTACNAAFDQKTRK